MRLLISLLNLIFHFLLAYLVDYLTFFHSIVVKDNPIEKKKVLLCKPNWRALMLCSELCIDFKQLDEVNKAHYSRR